MLADSLFRPPNTPLCSLFPSYHLPILPSYPSYSILPSYPSYSLFPSYPSYSLLPSYHLLLSHLTTSYSLLPSYHLLLSHLTTSYHQLVTPLLSLTHIFALLPPISLVSSLSPHLLLLLISSAMLLLFQLANFPLVNPVPTQLLFSKHSISKNRTFFLISHYYHFTMKT